MALVWPAMVRGDAAPDIIQIEITSGKDTFFYSPPLDDNGGTTYFNNLAGQGADQIITVTVTVSDDNATTFSGGHAFGITPTTNLSTSYGITSTWSVTYTIGAADTSEDGILFTITDGHNLTDTVTITFTQDNVPPDTSSMSFSYLADTDSGSDGIDPLAAHYDDPTIDLRWTVPPDEYSGGAGVYTLTTSFPPFISTTYFDTQASGTLTGTLDVVEDGPYTVVITVADRVGNQADETSPLFVVDTSLPTNGRLNVDEDDNPAYLYINPWQKITAGTLHYNNAISSSFGVTADPDPPQVNWGNSDAWYVEFGASWGNPAHKDYTRSYFHSYDIAQFETDDEFVVKFVNKAGNVQAITISTVLDTEGPQVVFTDVTDPSYDLDGDELVYGEPDDNWYRTSLLIPSWAFTAAITETGVGYAGGLADWDHQSDDNDDKDINPAFNGTDTLTGAFINVQDDSDGAVQVTVVATDHVNNVGSAALEIQLDGTSPVITPTGWSESSPYLHVLGDELFFSHMMANGQLATLSGFAADNQVGSGLDHAAFSDEANLAGSPSDDIAPDEWSGSYTIANDSTQGDGLAVVTVYDNVGNSSSQGFTYTEDATSPVVTYTGVTDPGYDPDGDELNSDGNWYTSSNLNDGPGSDGWVFFFDFSDGQTGARSASADWDHSDNSDDQLNYDPGLDNIGVFGTGVANSGTPVNDDTDGVVTVTLRIEDNVGNVGSDSLKLRIDNAPPTITNDGWTESSDYLYADGHTLYFSHLMGAVEQLTTLGGHVDDGPNGAGATGQAVITEEPSLSFSLSDDTLPDWSVQYLVSDSSLDTDNPVHVSVMDNLGNHVTRTYPYVWDFTSPTTPTTFTIDTLPIQPGYYDTQSPSLSWSPSSDSQSQLQGYYLGTSAPPSISYPPTTTTTTFDTGADGTFTFYLMAKDNVGHTSLTSTGPITIDTQAPVPWVQVTPEDNQDRILVEWGADDPAPGTWPVAYDVEYRVGMTGTPQIWIPDTTDTSAYFGPTLPVKVEIGTSYYFRVSARDYVNNQSDASAWESAAVGLKRTYLPVVIKKYDFSIPYATFDGFENGSFIGWNTGGVLPRSIIAHPVPPSDGTPPDSGTYAALLGSPSYVCGNSPNVPVGRAYIQALAYVPASGTPYLRFDYRVLSYDTVRSSGGEWWDRLEVQVNGAVLADVNGSHHGNSNPYGDLDPGNLSCSNLYDSGWSQAELDLSAYAGQTVTLTFFNENHKDGYWNTYSYLDNIRIETEP